MRQFISIIFSIFITITSSLIFPQAAWADASSLGVKGGYLSPCPETPNCVLSQKTDTSHEISPPRVPF